MVTFARVLLWTVVLVAPGGFLLVPLLAASLRSRNGSVTSPSPSPTASLHDRLRDWAANARRSLTGLQHYWTKS